MSISKGRDPRMWVRWRASGAVSGSVRGSSDHTRGHHKTVGDPAGRLARTLTHARNVAKVLRLGAEHLKMCGETGVEILEIVLFGSTARGEMNPADVDLMMFDRGRYSTRMSLQARRRGGDMYGRLKDNLEILLTREFGFDASSPGIGGLLSEMVVDLHVLPIEIFTDPFERKQIARLHADPKFFENAFSNMLRYDQDADDFVLVDESYFEKKYREVSRSFIGAEQSLSV